MSSVVELLNKLRPASVDWKFGKEEKQAYDKLKELLSSDKVLAIYNPKLELKLDTDASSVGIGGVLSQIDDSGVERPVEFVSRTLSKSERNYSQIEKEGLAIVWCLKRLHRYVYARPFTLVTDHKALEAIFHPHKSVPVMGISRIQRWALSLSSYQYKVKFRPTHRHSNADVMCSRFPLPMESSEIEGDIEDTSACTVHRVIHEQESISSVFSVHYFGDDLPPIDSDRIVKLTRCDPVLGKVLHLIKEGWSMDESVGIDENKPKVQKRNVLNGIDEMKPYIQRRHELSVDKGCVLWGSRVVVPEKLRQDVLLLLHSTHMGMSMTKSLARGYVWWPNIDAEIERIVKTCEACKLSQAKPPASAPHPWVKQTRPWERLHIDFCGPCFGAMWLVVICAHSKWLEVIRMNSIKSGPVIKELRALFSRFGLPKIIVSDNGPQLVSLEMNTFMTRNGINHVLIPSYHPASNGQAESLVGKFKSAMKRMCLKNPDVASNLESWLMNYRNTPHSVTGIEPAVAMLGRRTRNTLSLLHPLSNSRSNRRDCVQEQRVWDSKSGRRQLVEGDQILYWNEHHRTWNKGRIKEQQGTKVFVIATENGETRKHVDQIVKDNPSRPTDSGQQSAVAENEPRVVIPNVEHDHKAALPVTGNEPAKATSNTEQLVPKFQPNKPIPVPLPAPNTLDKRPSRVRKAPDWLNYDKLGGD